MMYSTSTSTWHHNTNIAPQPVKQQLIFLAQEKSYFCTLYYIQISDVEVVGREESMTAKEALLWWSQKVTGGYELHFLSVKVSFAH